MSGPCATPGKKKCKKCGGTIHGPTCKLCELFASGTEPGAPATTGWPIVSDAAAVHPDQVAEVAALDRRKGVPTEYTRGGQPILRDRAHRRAYLKIHKLRDNNSFTGY